MHITVDRCLLIWMFFALIVHEAFHLAGYVFVEIGERIAKLHDERDDRRTRLEREFNLGLEAGRLS